MDNSWDYHEGESEKRLGKALKGGYRSRAFVMTKVDGRSLKSAQAFHVVFPAYGLPSWNRSL